MYPIIDLGFKQIPTYTLMALFGVLAAGLYAYFQAKKEGIRPVDVVELLGVGAVGAVLGSHLLYGVVSLLGWLRCPEWEPSFSELFGGSVFYGGMLTGLLGGYVYLRIRHWPVQPFANLAARFIPLFHAFARVGCFLAGCCFGIECRFGFVMTRSEMQAANGVCRFPVQLLEALLNLGLFLILHFGRKRQRRQVDEKAGSSVPLLPVYLGLYSVIRFGDEFLRGDYNRGIFGPFSTSQWISLALLGGVIVYWVLRRIGASRRRREEMTR